MININKDPLFCTKCSLKKEEDEFYYSKKVPYKRCYYCKACTKSVYRKHKTVHNTYMKKYYLSNKISIAAYNKQYIIDNRPAINKYQRMRYAYNPLEQIIAQRKSRIKATAKLSDSYIKKQLTRSLKIKYTDVTAKQIEQKRKKIQEYRLRKQSKVCLNIAVN